MTGTERRRGHAAVVAALSLVLLGVLAVPAPASQTHVFKEAFGSAAQPSFGEASRIAIDRSNGDLLVIDRKEGTISRFKPDGSADAFSALGANAIDGKGGADLTPQEGLSFGSVDRVQIAVDNSGGATDGDIYVTQSPAKLIDVFSSTGEYRGQLTAAGLTPFSDVSGVAVDPAGAVYVSDATAGKIHKVVAAPLANAPVNGDLVASFTATSPRNLVVGAGPTAGFLFAKSNFATGVLKIDSASGELKYAFLGAAASFRAPLAVDLVSGHLFVQSSLEGSAQEWDASGATAPSAPLASFPLGKNPEGVAVTGSGEVYLTREGGPKAEVYGPTVTVPDVVTGAATSVAKKTATLNGTVNPDGVELTHCRFEYGKTTAYGQEAPCAQSNAAIGTGHSPVAVSADLTGLDLGAEYHFRLVSLNANTPGPEGGRSWTGEDRSFKLESPPVIGAEWTVGAVSSEAVLAALVDPEGFDSTYRFEYVDQAAFAAHGFEAAAKAPVPDGKVPKEVTGKANFTSGSATLTNLTTTAGAFAPGQAISGTGIPAGTTISAVDAVHHTLTLSQAVTSGANTNRAIAATGPQPVSQFLAGLMPGTKYHWRVVATNEIGEEESAPTIGSERTFTTHATPAAAGPDPCPNAAFRSGPGAALPDCRAYEMVSPLDKGGFDIRSGTLLSGVPFAINQSDPTGGKLTYTSNRAFCDAVSQPAAVQYLAQRGAGGWSCHALSPPRGILVSSDPGAGVDNEFQAFSDDLCTVWLVSDETTAPPLAPGATAEALNLYERSNCGAEGYRTLVAGERALPLGLAGAATLVRTNSGQLRLFEGEGAPAAVCALPDETTAASCAAGTGGAIPIYESSVSHALSDDAGRVYFTAAGNGPGPIYLRENPAAPQSALAHGAARGKGDLAAGSAVVSNLSAESGGFEAGQRIRATDFPRGAIPYGATVLSCAPACGAGATSLTLSAPASASATGIGLSAWSDCTEAANACTVPVSEAVSPGALSPELTTQKAIFWGARADGGAALFAFDPDHASNSEPGPAKDDLYRFEAATGSTALIAHNTLGVLGSSEDLSRVYLVSEEACGGGAAPGRPNLYLYEAGESCAAGRFAFIGALAAADARKEADDKSPAAASLLPTGHDARVSPGGGTAAFASYAPLTGYDNTDASSGEADLEVFRYEASTGQLDCVSCNPSGARPRGRHITDLVKNYWAAARLTVAQTALHYPRALSANGKRVFFESFEQLVLGDVNEAQDVYQWEAAGEGDCTPASAAFSAGNGGCLSLLSSGKNAKDSSFLDADPDGSDVFFTTEASLLSQDTGLIDIYDARIGGGFAPPASPPAPCEGEACQSPPAPPGAPTLSSSAFAGPGDIRPHKGRCPKGRHRAGRHGKAHCVRNRHHRRAHR